MDGGKVNIRTFRLPKYEGDMELLKQQFEGSKNRYNSLSFNSTFDRHNDMTFANADHGNQGQNTTNFNGSYIPTKLIVRVRNYVVMRIGPL